MPKGKPVDHVKTCPTCGATFAVRNNFHRYCSPSCRTPTFSGSTEWQYSRVSGNWHRYFQRLCTRSFNRAGLTPSDLIQLLERQGGRCALSGVELTCNLQRGVVCKTNASIDRIVPQRGYMVENIQLVCAALNSFRADTPIDEFIDWCRKVAEYAVHKKS